MSKKIVIVGASGHGRVLADIAKKNGYDEIAFLDDKLNSCGDYCVVGKTSQLDAFDCDIAVGIGNAEIRQKFIEMLESMNKHIATLIHPNAVVCDDVVIGCGSVVMAGAVINTGAVIGKGCIVNTCSSVDHDCKIDDYVHISVGSHLAGTVTVGKRTWIGIGAVVSNNISITADCMIGAGAVVVNDLDKKGTYIGVPAKLKQEELVNE